MNDIPLCLNDNRVKRLESMCRTEIDNSDMCVVVCENVKEKSRNHFDDIWGKVNKNSFILRRYTVYNTLTVVFTHSMVDTQSKPDITRHKTRRSSAPPSPTSETQSASIFLCSLFIASHRLYRQICLLRKKMKVVLLIFPPYHSNIVE